MVNCFLANSRTRAADDPEKEFGYYFQKKVWKIIGTRLGIVVKIASGELKEVKV